MAKFWIGRSGGSGGAGWIMKVFFDKPREYETDDPAMIEAVRKSTVARELEAEAPIEICPDTSKTEETLSDLTLTQLRKRCKEYGLSTHGKKSIVSERLKQHVEEMI